VSIAIDRRSGKWVVRWREGNRHRSRSFTLKRDAEIFERERQRARELGSLFLPDRGSQSLNDVVELWWTEHVLRSLQPTTRDGYLPVWGRHLRPALGAMPIRQLVVRRQRFIEPAVPAAIERLRAELLRTERLADASASCGARLRRSAPRGSACAEVGGRRRPGFEGRAGGSEGRSQSDEEQPAADRSAGHAPGARPRVVAFDHAVAQR
jgi:hypothetical protein